MVPFAFYRRRLSSGDPALGRLDDDWGRVLEQRAKDFRGVGRKRALFVVHEPSEVAPRLLAGVQNARAIGGKTSELAGAEEMDAEADRFA